MECTSLTTNLLVNKRVLTLLHIWCIVCVNHGGVWLSRHTQHIIFVCLGKSVAITHRHPASSRTFYAGGLYAVYYTEDCRQREICQETITLRRISR